MDIILCAIAVALFILYSVVRHISKQCEELREELHEIKENLAKLRECEDHDYSYRDSEVWDYDPHEAQELLLRAHLKRVPVGEDVDISALAKSLPVLTVAQIGRIAAEGTQLAKLEGRSYVVMADLEAPSMTVLSAKRV